MTYQEYLQAAKSCVTPEEAEKIINQAADDDTVSARQYFNIRHLAIKNAYNN
jgi:hypothetical protein